MTRTRPPCLLWANLACLMDTSSGAALAVREMLRQLRRHGWDVKILGATHFDNVRGTTGLPPPWAETKPAKGGLLSVEDGELTHSLYITASTRRGDMTNREEGAWFNLYLQALDAYKPDIIFYYGGEPFDFLISNEARHRNIPVAFYLANGNYFKKRWQEDVDLILTDSLATADLYKARLGLEVKPIGSFIDPTRILADRPSRERVLFVNPLPGKGGILVACVAMWLEQRRPDILFEIVESRGKWADIVQMVTETCGEPRGAPANVIVTPPTDDMRSVYGKARLLLAPSLWWESSGRVLAEAMLNGIPVICTNRGGMPEMIQDGGILLNLPAKYFEPPHMIMPDIGEIAQLGKLIESLYDDTDRYQALADCAYRVGRTRHGLHAGTTRLLATLQPLLG